MEERFVRIEEVAGSSPVYSMLCYTKVMIVNVVDRQTGNAEEVEGVETVTVSLDGLLLGETSPLRVMRYMLIILSVATAFK